jgi:hypothetical protein
VPIAEITFIQRSIAAVLASSDITLKGGINVTGFDFFRYLESIFMPLPILCLALS